MNIFFRRDYRYLVIGAVGILFAHWSAEFTWQVIGSLFVDSTGSHEGPPFWFGLLVTLSFVIFFPWIAIRFKNLWQQPFSRLHQKDPPPVPVLIWFLSFIPDRVAPAANCGVPSWFQSTGDLDKDLAFLKGQKMLWPTWSWEMALQGIRHHRSRLRVILLVASKESIVQVQGIQRLLRNYTELSNVHVLVLVKNKDSTSILECVEGLSLEKNNGWDFEDFNEQSVAIADALGLLNSGKISVQDGTSIKATDREIMIDFTGGQKPASVVAAAMTFRRPVQAQYVSTNSLDVVGYDFEWHSLEHESH